MKIIKLTQNKETKVDDETFDLINQYQWYYNGGYASRKVKTDKGWRTSWLHHLILPRKHGLVVDHINRDRLDNRLLNLRYATYSENRRNSSKRADSVSGLKGVSRQGSAWRSRIKSNGKLLFLGSFSTIEEAAEAYNRAAIAIFGEFASLNK